MTKYHRIRSTIENALDAGKGNFVIYPFGDNGMLTKKILNESFGVQECFVVDNKLSKYNPNVKAMESLTGGQYTVLFTVENQDVYEEARNALKDIFEGEIIDIFSSPIKQAVENSHKQNLVVHETICGKYSYGPLCEHWLVESVGAFCSFAQGTDVVMNHATEYISTHPFLYYSSEFNPTIKGKYEENKEKSWFFSGVKPKGIVGKLSKTRIGNDVWLGKNVIITNGANIGNGVIAAAGSVITKDVPDYAVVAGVPAKIKKYRYTSEQIEALNAIAWWNWSDEKIRECYDDFYLDVEEFIIKHI